MFTFICEKLSNSTLDSENEVTIVKVLKLF